MFSLLKKGCHGNDAIARFVQLFGSGITQFLNPEILSFHLMYDAVWSTAGLGPSPNLVICCSTISSEQILKGGTFELQDSLGAALMATGCLLSLTTL